MPSKILYSFHGCDKVTVGLIDILRLLIGRTIQVGATKVRLLRTPK